MSKNHKKWGSRGGQEKRGQTKNQLRGNAQEWKSKKAKKKKKKGSLKTRGRDRGGGGKKKQERSRSDRTQGGGFRRKGNHLEIAGQKK